MNTRKQTHLKTSISENAKLETSFKISKDGYYGNYGGRFAPELLIPALEELEEVFESAKKDKSFINDLQKVYADFVGRPTPFSYCENLSNYLGGARIYVKNEGAAHTGAHKINHCVGQALLAKRMKKTRIIAETGAGQHGLATAAVCARFGFECVVYMGEIDIARQRPNVFWMERFGAKVVPVSFGSKVLKDAVNAAMKDWITNVCNSHYLLGSCLGPHPFPEINRYFQKIVGTEIRKQMMDITGQLPDYVIACVGGGSNAVGAFDAFLQEKQVQLIGVEAGGKGIKSGQHAARFKGGSIGIVEGYKSYWLQDKYGQIMNTHSVSAGLDYPGVGPLHAHLHDMKRVTYTFATDKQAIDALSLLARTEGILPALESSHALAEAIRLAPTLSPKKSIVVNLSGRGDKDMFILAKHIKDDNFVSFLKHYSSNDK